MLPRNTAACPDQKLKPECVAPALLLDPPTVLYQAFPFPFPFRRRPTVGVCLFSAYPKFVPKLVLVFMIALSRNPTRRSGASAGGAGSLADQMSDERASSSERRGSGTSTEHISVSAHATPSGGRSRASSGSFRKDANPMQPPLQFSRLTGVFSPDEVERTYLESQFAGSTIAYIAFTLFLLLSHVILHFLGHGLMPPRMHLLYPARCILRYFAHRMSDQGRARELFGLGLVATSIISSSYGVYGVRAGLPTHLGRSSVSVAWLCFSLLVRQIFLRLSGFPQRYRLYLLGISVLAFAAAKPNADGHWSVIGRTGESWAGVLAVFAGEIAGHMLDILARVAHFNTLKEAASLRQRMEQLVCEKERAEYERQLAVHTVELLRSHSGGSGEWERPEECDRVGGLPPSPRNPGPAPRLSAGDDSNPSTVDESTYRLERERDWEAEWASEREAEVQSAREAEWAQEWERGWQGSPPRTERNGGAGGALPPPPVCPTASAVLTKRIVGFDVLRGDAEKSAG